MVNHAVCFFVFTYQKLSHPKQVCRNVGLLLLFPMINDIPNVWLHNNCKLFAGDFKLKTFPFPYLHFLMFVMGSIVLTQIYVAQWYNENGLCLNLSKPSTFFVRPGFKYFIRTPEGTEQIPYVSKIGYLGLLIDSNLNTNGMIIDHYKWNYIKGFCKPL